MSKLEEGIIAATPSELLQAVTKHNKAMNACAGRRLLYFEDTEVLETWMVCLDYCRRHACLGETEKGALTNSILDIIKQAGLSPIRASKVISQ